MTHSPLIVYIDEAGRWPLAWPVIVGAIIALQPTDTSSYRDSKQLSEPQRILLSKKIKADPALVWASGSTSAKLIDRHGIVRALRSAIIQALKKLHTKLTQQSVFLESFELFKQQCIIMLDGNTDFWLTKIYGLKVRTIIKGDKKIPLISAASIIAKTTRDAYMTKQHNNYPIYGFSHHKGYGTLIHRTAIAQYGLSPLHRVSYCKAFTSHSY